MKRLNWFLCAFLVCSTIGRGQTNLFYLKTIQDGLCFGPFAFGDKAEMQIPHGPRFKIEVLNKNPPAFDAPNRFCLKTEDGSTLGPFNFSRGTEMRFPNGPLCTLEMQNTNSPLLCLMKQFGYSQLELYRSLAGFYLVKCTLGTNEFNPYIDTGANRSRFNSNSE